jgi:hypothetical protein
MFFGKKSYQNPQRGVPASVKRQLFLLVGLLAGTVILGLQFWSLMNRQAERVPLAPAGKAPAPWGRDPTEAQLAESGARPIGTPLEAQPPEPFVEKPEVLEAAAAKDRTGEVDEKALAYLFQKVRTQGDALRKVTPALSQDKGDDDLWKELLETPGKYRGRLIVVKGNLVSSEPGSLPLRLRGLDYPNASGLDRAFLSYVVGVDGKFYMVATARKQRDLQHLEGVRLRGYFLQLFTYPIEYKGEERKATIPFLVGDDYDLLERPTTADVSSYSYLAILGILGVLAIVFVILIQRGSGRKYQSRRLAGKSFAGASRGRPTGSAPGASPGGSLPGGGLPDGRAQEDSAAGPPGEEGPSAGKGN